MTTRRHGRRRAPGPPRGCPRRRVPRHRLKRGPAEDGPLARRASRALSWSFGSTLLNKLSLFGIGVMLARLLGPHAFGTYAVAYVAMTALLTFNELGVSLAIIRWESEPSDIIPTVMTISLAGSVVLYAACFLAAPAYAAAMGAPAAAGVVRVLAILVLIDGFTNTPAALLQRKFCQGRRTVADQANAWLGTGTTLALAWSGHGAMSLAVGRVVGCGAGAILLAVFAPESLRLGFDPAKARLLLRFGLPLAGSTLFALAVTTVDQVVVGHLLGPVELGFYVLALNLTNWPVTMFSQPVSNVAPAVFARLQHDRAAMGDTFLSAAGLLCGVAAPVCLLIGGAATPLIGVVYGARWLPAARPLLWLAVLAAVQIFLLLAFDYLVVLARSRFLLAIQAAWLLALIPALIVGARAGGVLGAALAEALLAGFGILPWYLRELRRAGLRLGALARGLAGPAAGAGLVALAALGAARAIPGGVAALAVAGLLTTAVIGLLMYRMRTGLAAFRSRPGQPGVRVAPGPPAAEIARAPVVSVVAPARPLAAMALPLAAMVPAGPSRPGAAGVEPVSGRPAASVAEPPLSGYHDVLGLRPAADDLSATSPLYRLTVAALRWDPAYRGSAAEQNGEH
jgi:O-antigen/teichoic acid export membrane protein